MNISDEGNPRPKLKLTIHTKTNAMLHRGWAGGKVLVECANKAIIIRIEFHYRGYGPSLSGTRMTWKSGCQGIGIGTNGQ
jgi:hypothetical protein